MKFDPSRTRLYKSQIAARVNRTPRSVDNWIAQGKFPTPYRDENGRPFWWSDDVARHEAALTGGE